MGDAGQAGNFLVRTLDLRSAPKDYFIDDQGSPHEAAINALARSGVTTGCLPERFCPDNLISRGQLAYFLANALELPSRAVIQYSDIGDSPYSTEINSVVAAGIASGCTTDSFCPRDAVSRKQVAGFLRQSMGALPARGVVDRWEPRLD